MKYTSIPSSIGQEILRITKEPFNLKTASENPAYFAIHMLGIIPFKYQALIMNNFLKDPKKIPKRIIICKSRQIGLSMCVAMISIWYAFFNKAKTGIYKNTKVCVVSRSDDQAKKLMQEIRSMIYNSPMGLGEHVIVERGTPFNKKELHFEKGTIKCFPATDAIRGEAADLLIVDEAAFVDEQIFRDAMEPTISSTNGIIMLSSTPYGMKGLFYELFDPQDLRKKHEYERYWFHWKMCENTMQKRLIEEKLKYCKETGTIKSFEQEYEAKFTSDQESFFENDDIERGINNDLSIEYENLIDPCVIGIDWGISASETVITVTCKRKDKLILIFQQAEQNFDDNLIMDESWEHSIPNLCKRYRVHHIVSDSGPQSHRTNLELENKGYPLVKFNFRTDQSMGENNRTYYLFRSALRQGVIQYPMIRQLVHQMRCIQEVRINNGRTSKIKAPRGKKEDRMDSFLMSCHPFLTDQETFKSCYVEYEDIMKRIREERKDPRHDIQWDDFVRQDRIMNLR